MGTTIPDAAFPVVEVLRTVRRPEFLPTRRYPNEPLAFRDGSGIRRLSPLGLFPYPFARCSWPESARDLDISGIDDASVKAFNRWWQEQRDPLEAVVAIWGSQGFRRSG